MPAQRIRTGFHRIGVAIAVAIGVPSVGAMLMSLPVGMNWFPEEAKFNPADWPAFLIGGAIFLGWLSSLIWLHGRSVGSSRASLATTNARPTTGNANSQRSAVSRRSMKVNARQFTFEITL
jgi:hypothetical protein